MPSYYYTAKSFKGEQRTGTLEAKNKRELASLLRREGFTLIHAEAETIEKKRRALTFSLEAIRGISLTEKMLFSRHLALMLKAGVSISRALELLARQTKSRKFRNVILASLEDIKKGSSLADAFAKHPLAFNELYISMIRVGEEGGNLEEVLNLLANHFQKRHTLQSKIRGALMYPAVIIVAMIGVGILMLVKVVPQLTSLFNELNIELPLATKIVIIVGNFAANCWYLFLVIPVVLIILWRMFLGTLAGKKLAGRFLLQFPLFGDMTRKINSASLSRTTASLIKAGMPIVQTLRITSRTVGNWYFRDALFKVSARIEKGAKLAEAFGEHKELFPIMVIQMIEVGEETGTLSEILTQVAEFYEEEVATLTEGLSSIIEPILMVIIGAVVGFFAISMIQPMYSMLGAV